MGFIYCIFWLCLAFIFYNYFGYGLLVWIIIRIRPLLKTSVIKEIPLQNDTDLPPVTLVIAAYNEETVIEEKIHNSLQLDYPSGKLNILFITDGSVDHTPDIVSCYPQLQLLHSAERTGKTAALNKAMQQVKTPITVFCDANTILNKKAIRKIVAHYSDSKTGGVAGEKGIFSHHTDGTAGVGEGLYWKYESALKRLDANLYTVVGAAGELFSIRTALWEPVEPYVILDDFVISLRINLKGYRIAYEPEAFAMELPSASMKDEKKRKVRISAGAFQAISLLKPVFNVFRHPVLFFQFFSHRFLRWTLVPLSLPFLLISSIVMTYFQAGSFYLLMLAGQVIFYGLAFLGASEKDRSKIFKLIRMCYYIVFMNWAVYLGFIRFLKGGQSAMWERAEREVAISMK